MLLLHANRVVPAQRLIEAAWDGHEPPSARTQIQGFVSMLRRGLAVADRSHRIATQDSGYLLRVGPDELDLDAFQRYATAGREAHRLGELDQAADRFAQALRLWRGKALDGISPSRLLEAEVTRLDRLRIGVVEEHARTQLDLGWHDQVLAELLPFVQEHPLHEGLRELLMLALHRSGRRDQALKAYQEVRRELVDQLGVEPGPALHRLHQRILAADPELDLPAKAERAPVPVHVVRPTQLPADLGDFTGRADQVKVLGEMLATVEWPSGAVVVSSVTGTGGIGKSSLVVHAGHRFRALFPDGQLWFCLRGSGARPVEPGEVLARFLRDLGEDPAGIPAGEDERAARFRSVVADRQLLIVLDDARDAAQVRPLLPGTSGCAVLVTSRSPLADLPGARSIMLGALPANQALELLATIIGIDRASAEPDAAISVVELCAGLPLALRIAGARLAARPHWRVRDLADRLSDAASRLDELVVGDLSVRASFAVSYGNLPAVGGGEVDPARAFRLLGLWSGLDIGVPAAAALFGVTDQAAERALETLLDSHLLQPGWSARRYRLHDLLRVYAAERAGEEEPQAGRDDAVRRLVTWYLQTAHAAAHILEPQIQRIPLTTNDSLVRSLNFDTYQRALQWCETERTNLVAAIRQAAQHGLHALAWQLPLTLRRFFRLGKYWTDWIVTFQIALASARVLGERGGEGLILFSLGEPYTDLGRMDEAIDHLRDALTIHREIGDRRAEARTLSNLGVNYGMLGRFAESVNLLHQALAIHRDIGNRYNEAIVLENIGEALRGLRKFDEAVDHLQQALVVHGDIGDRYNQGSTLTTLGDVYQDLQLDEKATHYYEQALSIRRSLGDRGGEASTLIGLGHALHRLNRTGEAREAWRQAHSILADIGDPRAADVEARLASTE
jgi:DNA-binding SARP family transcriptional activator/Flp pilus assembly protein TadD